jgi:hypothetical protein
MSDRPLGVGWWLASDGRFYPPSASQAQPLPAPPTAHGQGGQGLASPDGYRPAQRQPRSTSNKTGCIVVAVLLAIPVLAIVLLVLVPLLLLASSDGNRDPTEITSALHADDFDSIGAPTTEPASCAVVGIQLHVDEYQVDVTVTNQSGEFAHYRVDFELLDPQDVSLGGGYGQFDYVNPDETATTEAFSPIPAVDTYGPDIRCQVTGVLRVPA